MLSEVPKSRLFAALVTLSILLSGCTGGDGGPDSESEEITGCTDQDAENYNPNATVSDSSCIYPQPEEESILIEETGYCDDTNPYHCMMPFPSGAFLEEDAASMTGYALVIPGEAIPDTQSAVSGNMHILDRLDGFSPSTQIMTAFERVPNLSGLANQFDISPSASPEHGSILLNLDTGEVLHHWVENDARADEGQTEGLVFLRTLAGLGHNTAYAVAFRNISDLNGNPISPSDGFRALRDGIASTAPGIESQRDDYEVMFQKLQVAGFERGALQAAWWFHTASTQSILRDIQTMRLDAEERLGEDGVGCTVTEVHEGYGDPETTLRRVRGTITTPQYTLAQDALSPMARGEEGDPVFVENREVEFTALIPKSLADNNTSGPITVIGHGLFGNGDSYVSQGGAIANEYGLVLLATDFKGWSSDGDSDALTFALLDFELFQYQQERQMQAVINHLAMIRTITGVCIDIPELTNYGVRMIDADTVNYWGYSLGGLRGPSLLAMVPELDWGVLWVGGTSFTHQVERSTHYGCEENPGEFYQLLSSPISLPKRFDRAIAIALLQSIWDSTDGETFLPFHQTGLEGYLEPFDMFYLSSMMDAQVTTLSADRAVRTAGVAVVSGSAYHPFGVEVVDGPIDGSGAAYFDGQFPSLPTGNINGPSWHHSLAHNLVAEVPEAQSMAYEYLLTGILEDHCDPSCTFDGEW